MIKLIGGYYITADKSCYVVGKLGKDKNGKAIIQNPKYHTSIGNAVSGVVATLLREEVEKDKITTLEEFVKRNEALQKRLCAMVKVLE